MDLIAPVAMRFVATFDFFFVLNLLPLLSFFIVPTDF